MRYEDMEQENLKNILSSIETDIPFPSRADVAKHLGLSRAAVTGLVNRLETLHLVSENGTVARPNRGRPASPLHIDREYWQVLGASLRDFTWEFVIANLEGSILHREERVVEPFSISSMISELCIGLQKIQDTWNGHLLPGVGIGVPGVVDEKNGDIVFAYDFGWTERINISGPVFEQTSFIPYVMNRFSLEGVAEFKFANPDRLKDLVYIGVGSGIRSAILSGGKILRGKNFSAGRISHIQIDPNGEKCTCGRTGCLFTYASEMAIVKDLRKRMAESDTESSLRDIEDNLSVNAIAAAADEGDMLARQSLKRAAEAVAHAVVSISDLLNPDKIIIGGPTGSSDYFINTVNEALKDLQDKSPYTAYTVSKAQLSDYSSALGASYLVSRHKLELAMEAEDVEEE